MSGINKVILVGRIQHEPEMEAMADNVPALSFQFATSEIFFRNGKRTEQIELHNIVMGGVG